MSPPLPTDVFTLETPSFKDILPTVSFPTLNEAFAFAVALKESKNLMVQDSDKKWGYFSFHGIAYEIPNNRIVVYFNQDV